MLTRINPAHARTPTTLVYRLTPTREIGVAGRHVILRLRQAEDDLRMRVLSFHDDAMSVATSTETAQLPLDPEEEGLRLVIDQGIIEAFGEKGVVAAVFVPPDPGRIASDAEAAQDSGLSRVSVSEILVIGRSERSVNPC